MKIYTKTGDKGETGIIGKRLSKGSILIDVIGTIDELNASIGIILTKLSEQKEVETLTLCQNVIFDIGAILANGKSSRNFAQITKTLENEIDSMEVELPKLQNFILPGGSELSAHIHMSRAICRRAERRLVELTNEDSNFGNLEELRADLHSFINRLSDYLFVLARYANFKLGYEDIIWKSK